MAGAASVMSSVAMPSASAAPCPDAEVIFARGTMEAPGVGPTGEAFVESLRSNVAPRSVRVYPVNYPATTDFPTAVQGIADARARIMSTAASCPDTQMVLGGFSQGAAVIGFVTASVVPEGVSPTEVPTPMPAEIADHVSAVALFGTPSTRFMRMINNPSIVVGPNYLAKSIELCAEDDFVCDPKGGSFDIHTRYAQDGLAAQGASFAASKLQDDWARQESEVTPDATLVGTETAEEPDPLQWAQQLPHIGQAPQRPGPVATPVPPPPPVPAAPRGPAPGPAAPLA